MDSQISKISTEYKVWTITDDEFMVIYTASAAKVQECLDRISSMFKKSCLRVAGLDVEYTTTKGKEKDLKEEEMAKLTMI